MRTFHLFIAALAVIQCVRYGRSAWLFVAPSARADPEVRRNRRTHLIGFVVVLLSLVLLASSLRELLRGGPPG